MLGVKGHSVPPSNIHWPAGFSDVYEFARIGGGRARPKEFDHISRIGGDNPHRNYPLRNVGEESFEIGLGMGMFQRVGNLTLRQAIREAYPGAIYMHMGRRWRVQEWRSTAWNRIIRVSPWNAPIITRPSIRTFVNVDVERGGLVAGNLRKGSRGFLAECQLQITETVVGYEERGEKKAYKHLRQENPNMTQKIRDFRTTGVVLKIEESWMRESQNKRELADALRNLTVREYSIAPTDIDGAATNIALVQNGQRQTVSDTIVIYDATYGSLRLTEPVFNNLGALIARLVRSSELASHEGALVPDRVAAALRYWFADLEAVDSCDSPVLLDEGVERGTDGLLLVLAPESIVAKRDGQGLLHDIEIIEPEIMSFGGPPKLFYSYKTSGVGRAMAAAEAIEIFGDEYSYKRWNPKTSAYVEEDEDTDNMES